MTKPIDPDVLTAYAEAAARQSGRAPAPAQTVTEIALAPRKPRGQAGHITPAERLEIQQAYLTTPGGVTISQLARDCGRTREAIAGCLKGEDFEGVKQAVHSELVAVAKDRLSGSVGLAAESWVASLGVAAAKGDHKPSKELLLHTGVISPVNEGFGGGGVQVLVLMPGQTRVEPPVIDVSAVVDEER
jgi:hypothetical protein